MKTKVFFIMALFVISQIAISFRTARAQDHIVLNTFNVNIRTGPSTDYFVVCMAGKGDIFKLDKEHGDWLQIEMFSGDNRFVHRDLVYFLTEFVDGHNMRLPDSEEKTREIYNDILWAKSRAKKDADEIIPAEVSDERHNNFLKLRQDKHIHDFFERYAIQPAMYPFIMDQAKKKKW